MGFERPFNQSVDLVKIDKRSLGLPSNVAFNGIVGGETE
jgi:hypothetical protein